MSNQSPSTATITRYVEWVDTDASMHQHNSLVVRLVESAERQLMADAGVLDVYFWAAPRVRQEIDFKGKLYFGQQVSATVVLERLGRASMTFSFEVWGEEYGEVPRRMAASGKFIVAHVLQHTESSTPWPDEIVNALTARESAE